MLHKAPAAFGLSTYLTSTGEKRRVVVQQLLLFSLAAPFGAFATYYGMYMGLWGYKLSKIALVLLFSGGTFLFVATVHILPELIMDGGKLTWAECWTVVFGVMFPVFINVEHGH